MNLLVRPENPSDYECSLSVVQAAFYRPGKSETFNEWQLVRSIRLSAFYLADLSLVAVKDNQIVGHIMATPITINHGTSSYDSIAIAPLAVEPKFQKQGIGSQLMKSLIARANTLGYDSIFLMGNPNYYMRFGFQPASKWQIGINDNFNLDFIMAMELKSNALDSICGNIQYCELFYDLNGELI